VAGLLLAAWLGAALYFSVVVTRAAFAVLPSRAAELAVLTVSNLLATVLRFALLRTWVFRGEAR